MIQIRLVLRLTILFNAIAACQFSGAAQCNGQAMFNVQEEKGILSVTSQSGAIASSPDMGASWIVGQPEKSELRPFWLKTFRSSGSIFQNVKRDRATIVINKAIEEEFWSISNQHHLILFGKERQLFGFQGKLYADGTHITLDSGQLTGSSEVGFSRPFTIEVTPRTFCQLVSDAKTFNKVCKHPFHALTEDHMITGFHAQANGNFFMSTYKDILYLDVAADKWVRIPPPVQWQCSP